MKRLILAAFLTVACSRKPAEQTEVAERFRDAAQETGLSFVHANGATGEFYMHEIMGAGVAVLDYDNDGDLDVFFVQSKGPSQLFRNELIPSGKLKFTNVTAQSGIAYDGYGMGVATGDIDNDGFVDLLITGWQKTVLYRNKSNGTFEYLPIQFPDVWSTSASFFDYDRDGRLDLVVLSYVNFTISNNKKCQTPAGEPDYCTPKAYSPVSARLYHNESGGRFTDVTEKSGIDRALGPGLGVLAADFNNDQWPDLFVANDTAENHVWINQRNGTFREAGVESGAAYSEDGLPKAGMGVAAGDYDNDGDDDLIVLNLMREGATLFRNEGVSAQGLPSFLDVTRQAGLYQTTFAFTGFGVGWLDYDNDGRLDLFMANGAVTLREELRGQLVPYRERNLLFHNDSTKFNDVSAKSGKIFDLLEVTRGAAFGDIDNDGDVDVLVTNNNGPARVLLNESPKSNWLTIKADGKQPIGAGAKVSVYREGLSVLHSRFHTDSSYCSANDPRVHFGLGDQSVVRKVEISWPDGSKESWDLHAANQVVTLKQGTGQH